MVGRDGVGESNRGFEAKFHPLISQTCAGFSLRACSPLRRIGFAWYPGCSAGNGGFCQPERVSDLFSRGGYVPRRSLRAGLDVARFVGGAACGPVTTAIVARWVRSGRWARGEGVDSLAVVVWRDW